VADAEIVPTIPVGKNTKAALLIEWGDDDANGKPDVTISTFGVLPIIKGGLKRMLHLGPFNVPVAEAQQIITTGIGLLPIPPPVNAIVMGIVAGIFAVLRIVL